MAFKCSSRLECNIKSFMEKQLCNIGNSNSFSLQPRIIPNVCNDDISELVIWTELIFYYSIHVQRTIHKFGLKPYIQLD